MHISEFVNRSAADFTTEILLANVSWNADFSDPNSTLFKDFAREIEFEVKKKH